MNALSRDLEAKKHEIELKDKAIIELTLALDVSLNLET